MVHLVKESPSQKKSINLAFDREIHFGPMLFNATFYGLDTNENLGPITENLCWSDDEHYLAVVEVIYDKSIDTNLSRLKLIDTHSGKVSTIDTKKGQIVPKSVSNSGDIKY